MTLVCLKKDQFICRSFRTGHFFSLSLYFVSSLQAIISYPGYMNTAMENNRIYHLSASLNKHTQTQCVNGEGKAENVL